LGWEIRRITDDQGELLWDSWLNSYIEPHGTCVLVRSPRYELEDAEKRQTPLRITFEEQLPSMDCEEVVRRAGTRHAPSTTNEFAQQSGLACMKQPYNAVNTSRREKERLLLLPTSSPSEGHEKENEKERHTRRPAIAAMRDTPTSPCEAHAACEVVR